MIQLSPLAVYVHWPYCAAICPYCDFNRYLNPGVVWQEWMEAFSADIKTWKKRLGPRELSSIFFGGGTPSLMHPDLVQGIIEALQAQWPTQKKSEPTNVEITLEMNPKDIAALEGLQRAGINRISLGVQSFDEKTLHFLGRDHTPDVCIQALKVLHASGVRMSLDLIYAHPLHTHAALWEQELTEAMHWAGEHVSLYQLTYKPGTPFYAQRHQAPGEDLILELDAVSESILESHGLLRYEISNYSKPGAESQHNLAYWNYQDYLGLGPGAHGRITLENKKYATTAHKLPKNWLGSLKEHGHALQEEEALTRQQEAVERLLMGLRLKEGIPLESLLKLGEAFTPEFMVSLDILKKEGFLHWQTSIAMTPKGRPLVDSIVAYLCREKMLTSM